MKKVPQDTAKVVCLERASVCTVLAVLLKAFYIILLFRIIIKLLKFVVTISLLPPTCSLDPMLPMPFAAIDYFFLLANRSY